MVDLLLILVGAWMIARGWWTEFAEVLMAVCLVGLAVSATQLWRGRRPTKR